MANNQEEWIAVPEASQILSKNSGHTVSKQYVIRLTKLNKFEVWKINAHALLLKRSSVERYRVKPQQQKQTV